MVGCETPAALRDRLQPQARRPAGRHSGFRGFQNQAPRLVRGPADALVFAC